MYIHMQLVTCLYPLSFYIWRLNFLQFILYLQFTAMCNEKTATFIDNLNIFYTSTVSKTNSYSFYATLAIHLHTLYSTYQLLLLSTPPSPSLCYFLFLFLRPTLNILPLLSYHIKISTFSRLLASPLPLPLLISFLSSLFFSNHISHSPSAVIILVFKTSKGFPTIDPRAPAKEPAANFKRKGESAFTPDWQKKSREERKIWREGRNMWREERKIWRYEAMSKIQGANDRIINKY